MNQQHEKIDAIAQKLSNLQKELESLKESSGLPTKGDSFKYGLKDMYNMAFTVAEKYMPEKITRPDYTLKVEAEYANFHFHDEVFYTISLFSTAKNNFDRIASSNYMNTSIESALAGFEKELIAYYKPAPENEGVV